MQYIVIYRDRTNCAARIVTADTTKDAIDQCGDIAEAICIPLCEFTAIPYDAMNILNNVLFKVS